MEGPPDFEYADPRPHVVRHPHAQMISAASTLKVLGTYSAHGGEPRSWPFDVAAARTPAHCWDLVWTRVMYQKARTPESQIVK